MCILDSLHCFTEVALIFSSITQSQSEYMFPKVLYDSLSDKKSEH